VSAGTQRTAEVRDPFRGSHDQPWTHLRALAVSERTGTPENLWILLVVLVLTLWMFPKERSE
jgi:hypothetical protein